MIEDRPALVVGRYSEGTPRETLLETKGGGRKRKKPDIFCLMLWVDFLACSKCQSLLSVECRGRLYIYLHRSHSKWSTQTYTLAYFASFFSNTSKTPPRSMGELVRRLLKPLLLCYLIQMTMMFYDHPSTCIICLYWYTLTRYQTSLWYLNDIEKIVLQCALEANRPMVLGVH